jgi:hypothetical protein
MQPVKSYTTSTGRCLNPVSSKCVIWDGPDITCLDGTTLCKGQSIETTVYNVATKLCQVYEVLSLENINTCINNIQDGNPAISISPSSSIQEVFSSVIQKVCSLTSRVEELENTPCSVDVAIVPECIRNYTSPCFPVAISNFATYDSATNTLPVTDYANAVARLVCCMLTDISNLQNNVANINAQIEDLWNLLNTCSNATTSLVLPTCTNNFILNPTNSPVTVQQAYTWLEADFCSLQGVVGTPDAITDAITKQCPDLNNADKLGSGGTMSGISGWVDSPTTLSDSLTNLWLTVCDMRSAVTDILNSCCFSLCNYLELGYDIVFDPNGTYINITFNGLSSPTIYTDPLTPHTTVFTATPGGTFPASWTTSEFPTADQTNVIITISDGIVTATFDTGMTINDWAIESNANDDGYQILYSDPGLTGYDKTSLNQTINIYFTYKVDDGTTSKMCEVNQTDGFQYECCAPAVYPCDVEITSGAGASLTVVAKGLTWETPQQASGTATAGTANTLEDLTATFATAGSGLDNYIVYITGGTGIGQCRYITSNTATELTVDSNWDTNPNNTSQYEVVNFHYGYPFTNPAYPDCIKLGLQTFTVQVIQVTGTSYNPLDTSTWQITASTNPPISPATLATTGYTVPPGVLLGNTEYAVAIYANYTCGQSVVTLIDDVTPIAASVAIQIGSPGNPVVNTLSTATVSVTNILSNGVSLPDENASITVISEFQLNLPVSPDTTEFILTPAPAAWVYPGNGITPIPFCACGINLNPQGFYTVNGQNYPLRNQVIGLYRGYGVSLFLRDSNNINVLNPILDSSPTPIPYSTNSISDPSISFSTNTPNAPITLNIPDTLTSSIYPVVVRYNPLAYPVNLGALYHTIRLANYTIIFDNQTGSSADFEAEIIIDIQYWDQANSVYQPYSPARFLAYYTGAISVGGGATQTITFTPPALDVQCAYGDAMFVRADVKRANPTGVNSNSRTCTITTTPSAVAPQQYSCAGLSHVVGPVSMTPILGSPTGTARTTSKSVITEDYDVNVAITHILYP